MKRLIFLLPFLLVQIAWCQSAADFTSHTILVNEEFSIENYNNVNAELLKNYPDRISSITFNPSEHSILFTTNLAPIDLLQILGMGGYICLYKETSGKKWELSMDGSLIKEIKE